MLDPLPKNQWSPAMANHLLCRAGFGGPPEAVKAVYDLGLTGAVTSLLEATNKPQPLPVDWAGDTSLFDLQRASRIARREGDQEEAQRHQKEMQQEQRRRMENIRELWISRMVETDQPLAEKLTLFWHGHFATSVTKVRDSELMWRQNETLRAIGTQSFDQLVKAISRDGAMIRWLDLNQSSKSAPNENFARELLELFTLGEGNYSETDIKEAARAFTGYRLNPRGGFVMNDAIHDTGVKKFMGKSRAFDGDGVIDTVLADRQCGRFIAGRIWEFFGGIAPAPVFQRLLGDTLRQGDYEIRPFLKRVFLSKSFYSPQVMGRQIKSPIQWLVQACRTLQISAPPSRVLREWLETLGQQPFAPPNVRGWEGGRSWMSATTLLARSSYAGELTGNSKSGIKRKRMRITAADPGTWVDVNAGTTSGEKALALARRLYGPNPPAHVIAIAETALVTHGEAPSGLAAAAHDLMSMPEYQLT